MQQHEDAAPLLGGSSIRFGVRVGSWPLLIAPQTFSEVLARAVVHPLPHTPRWFLGMVNQRGNLLPVFDLHQVWHLPEAGRGARTILVLDQGQDAVGFCIDGMPQSVRLEQRLTQLPPVPASLAAHVGAAYRSDRTTWLDFAHQTFFTALGAQLPTAA